MTAAMRALSDSETRAYLAGHVAYPGALETADGVMVPAPTDREISERIARHNAPILRHMPTRYVLARYARQARRERRLGAAMRARPIVGRRLADSYDRAANNAAAAWHVLGARGITPQRPPRLPGGEA